MEAQEPPLTAMSQLADIVYTNGLQITDDGLISWNKDSPQYPRNWPWQRKAYNAFLVIFLDFFISSLGTVGSAATKYSKSEFAVGSTTALVAFTSMFFTGQAIGGIVFPPYSESFGRKKLYLFSTILFAAFSILIARASSIAAVFVGRFITGLVSAVPSIVAAGSIEDIFVAKTRIWLVTVWLVIANLSLVLGPIFASYISASIGWQCIFYISTIVATIASLLLLATKESRASLLLQDRLRAIQKATGNSSIHIQNPDHVPDLRTLIRVILFRPLRLLFTEPIVFMVSMISGIAFALIYLFTVVLPIVYGSYGFSDQQASLAFIAIGIGFLCSIFTRTYDRNLFRQHGSARPISPEAKLTGFAIASPAFAIGLWWFAWTIPPEVPHVPWIVSMLALMPIGFAINEFDCVLVGYLTDSYTTFASSAFASLSLVRSLLSSVFPLFARQMYTGLGPNYATTILAAIATLAVISPVILIRYGKRIRQASKFARYSLALEGDYSSGTEMDEGVVGVAVPTGI